MILCATLPFGLVVMCWGLVASSIIAMVINTHYTGKLIQVGFRRQIYDLLPTLVYSISMGILVWGVVQLVPGNLLKLISGVFFGAVYFLVITKITHSADLRELFSFVKSK